MSDARSRVNQAAMDAQSNETLASDESEWPEYVPDDLESPLDRVTLDEQHAKGMGDTWEQRRRGEG